MTENVRQTEGHRLQKPEGDDAPRLNSNTAAIHGKDGGASSRGTGEVCRVKFVTNSAAGTVFAHILTPAASS